MRKIRIFEHISLDGVIEHDGDYAYGAWTAPYRSPAGLTAVIEAHGTGFDLLLGGPHLRYPDRLLAEGREESDGGRSERRDEIRRDPQAGQPRMQRPVKDLGADIVEGVRGIKSKDGPDLIVWGSSTLTSVLLGQGLVDEVVLFVYPVLLGHGERILSDRG